MTFLRWNTVPRTITLLSEPRIAPGFWFDENKYMVVCSALIFNFGNGMQLVYLWGQNCIKHDENHTDVYQAELQVYGVVNINYG